MRVTDKPTEGGGYEQHYCISIGSVDLPMVRRPVSILPKEGTICFVDDGPRHGNITRHTAAVFQDGQWKRCKFEPTHWTHWE